MGQKSAEPFWIVRGVNRDEDVTLVVEAISTTSAECFAVKRGIEVVVVTQATPEDILTARQNGKLWRYTPEARLTCLGRPLGKAQAAVLLFCGLATMVLNLRAFHVPLGF